MQSYHPPNSIPVMQQMSVETDIRRGIAPTPNSIHCPKSTSKSQWSTLSSFLWLRSNNQPLFLVTDCPNWDSFIYSWTPSPLTVLMMPADFDFWRLMLAKASPDSWMCGHIKPDVLTMTFLLGLKQPTNLLQEKGWQGQPFEYRCSRDAGSLMWSPALYAALH